MARTSINVKESTRNIVIKDNNNSTNVSVTQEITDIVNAVTVGPQGSQGGRGIQGPKGEPGQLTFFEDLTITGSLFVSGGNGNGEITASLVSASGTGSFGHIKATNIEGTTDSPLKIKGVRDLTFNNASLEFGANSNLFGNPIFHGDVNIVSGTAFLDQFDHEFFRSQATGQGVGNLSFGSTGIGTKIQGTSINVTTALTSSGAISSSGGFIGNLEGTSSFATSASYALTSSHALDALSASHATDALSSSFAITASFALNAGEGIGFPFTGSAEITGSLNVVGPITSSGIIKSTNGFIGGLAGTASHAVTSSHSITASYALLALTASHALNGGGSGTGFPFTGSAKITGSLNVIGPITSSGVISSSGGFTGSLEGSASYALLALTASHALNSGGSGAGFPFTGSAEITGSLNTAGPITGSVVTALPLQGQVSGSGNNLSLIATNAYTSNPDDASRRGGDIVIKSGNASTRSLAGDIIISGGLPSIAPQGTKGQLLVDTRNITIDSGSFITSGNLKVHNGVIKIDNKKLLSVVGAESILGADAQQIVISGSKITTQAAITSSNGFVGDLVGTSSVAEDAISASHAITASFALNVPESSGFPFTGSAEITGSLNVVGPITASSNIQASAFIGDGTQLTGIGGNAFPFTGSAAISGGLSVEGTLFVSAAITTTSEMVIASTISHFGDANTKFGFPFNDTFEITTNGIDRFQILNDGNINVETLKLKKTSTAIQGGSSSLFIQNSSGETNLTNRAGIEFKHVNSKVGGAIFSGKDNSYAGGNDSRYFSSNLQFYTALKGTDIERLRINASGSISASGAITASAFKGDGSGLTGLNTNAFPFTGSAVITGSLDVIGPITSSGVISSSGGFTGSLEGSASYALLALTASHALNADGSGFPFTGSAVITGSLNVIGSTTSSFLKVGTSNRHLFIQGGSSLSSTNPKITSNHSQIEFDKDIFMSLNGSTPTKIIFDTSDTFIAADANNPENLEIHADNDIELRPDGIVHATSIISASGFTGSLEGTASFADEAEMSQYTSEWIINAYFNTHYTFTGPGFTGSVSDPDFYLVRGQKYKFTNNMGQHPFRIQSTPNGATGTQYNNGVTNNDVSNGTLIFDVPMNAPEVLYYQCTSHPAMGGPIYISHPTSASFATTASFSTTSSFAQDVASQVILDAVFPFTGSAAISGGLDVVGKVEASRTLLYGLTGSPLPTPDSYSIEINPGVPPSTPAFININDWDRLQFKFDLGQPVVSIRSNGIHLLQQNKIAFNDDGDNTYIAADANNPENLEIHADQNIILAPDGKVVTNNEISGSNTGSFQYLKLDYDNMPSSNPGIKGVVYRDTSNQLFISTGSS